MAACFLHLPRLGGESHPNTSSQTIPTHYLITRWRPLTQGVATTGVLQTETTQKRVGVIMKRGNLNRDELSRNFDEMFRSQYFYNGTHLLGPPVEKVLKLAHDKCKKVKAVLKKIKNPQKRYQLFINRTRNKLDVIREILVSQLNKDRKKRSDSIKKIALEFKPFADAVPSVLNMYHLRIVWAVDIFVLILFGVLNIDNFNGYQGLRFQKASEFILPNRQGAPNKVSIHDKYGQKDEMTDLTSSGS